MGIEEQLDTIFGDTAAPQAPPRFADSRCLVYMTFYTQEGQARNITIRADTIEELFDEQSFLENFVAIRGWTSMPPNFQMPRPAQAPTVSTSYTPPMPEEPVYEDIHTGPIKLQVQTVELNFTKSGQHPGTPFLKVKVNHPAITKPVMAWFPKFKDLGVVTMLMPNTPTAQIPPKIKFVHVEQGTDQKGQPEWQVKYFSAQ